MDDCLKLPKRRKSPWITIDDLSVESALVRWGPGGLDYEGKALVLLAKTPDIWGNLPGSRCSGTTERLVQNLSESMGALTLRPHIFIWAI